MYKTRKLSFLSILLAAIIVVSAFAGCSSRSGDEDSSSEPSSKPPSSSSSSSPSSLSVPEGWSDFIPELSDLAYEKWEINEDTVGWLRVPDTTIDDVVVWKEGDNDYYLRRNFEKRSHFNGVYYADKRATFGRYAEDLGKNTCIYGHSLSDNKDDVKFGPMRYYLEEDFAREHPYIFFSTPYEDIAWEVVAVFRTHFEVPYNRNDLTDTEWDAMMEEVLAKSIYNYNVELSDDDKFLTLSTCLYALPEKGTLAYPNAYRFGIMARMVQPGEEVKTEADFELNSNVKPA